MRPNPDLARTESERLIRGSRNEYIPANKAVIPTPEEEAQDAARAQGSKFGNGMLLFMLLLLLSAIFRNDIEALMTLFGNWVKGFF